MKHLLAVICLLAAGTIASQFVTIFVVPPIDALPQGRTIVITRLNTMKFIDSADAWCERYIGGVSLLCREAVMAQVVNQTTILMRLPYSSILYEISTNGKTYDR